MLKRFFVTLVTACTLTTTSLAMAATGETFVKLVTSEGNIELSLDNKKAPITTKNFIQYVEDGYYNGTTFHRVIPGFMIQGGGFTADLQQKQTREPIKNEADNGLRNLKGTIAILY